MLHILFRSSKPRSAMAAGMLILLSCVGATAGDSFAQMPAVHTLTQSDNGTTLSVPIGDTIELRLPQTFNWDVSISNYGVLTRPPLALVRGVQGLWRATTPGESIITATGSPRCDPSSPCPALAAVFSATIEVVDAATPAPSPAPGSGADATANYPAGWNLVGGPPGTVFPSRLSVWVPGLNSYQVPDPSNVATAGAGYWAYFATPTTVAMFGPGLAGASIQVPAGQWKQVGNPSARTSVTVTGADAVYIYDAPAGSYAASATLVPGQGAWVYSSRGAAVQLASTSGGR